MCLRGGVLASSGKGNWHWEVFEPRDYNPSVFFVLHGSGRADMI